MFEGVTQPVVLSTNRNFSAPVQLTVQGETQEHLVFLMAHDSDPFNRWDAGQRLMREVLVRLYKGVAG